MVALRARRLRMDVASLALPLALLPGLAVAAAHAPVAVCAVGPLVLSTWVLALRDRFLLDRCEVHIDGPALELRWGRRRLDALDLRYAARHRTPRGDVVLFEPEGNFLVFGTDPPESAYLRGTPDGEALPGLWRAVRLSQADLQRLGEAVDAVPTRPPPDPADPVSLVEALGSVGTFGPRAERLLGVYLRDGLVGGRPPGWTTVLHEVALRSGAAGEAARRLLGQHRP
ncbi:MAG: hypothetical protein RMK29_10130 [Myxococcales bacterium]|nr:hypothetical protein [Myxococcota bacterium]MDW8282060.1 hypothetical protein [Myxococcales bacterium]